MTQVPDYIERRIRQPIPAGLCVIPGTTPVVAFGDAQTARVATLGLNPSYLEFQLSSGLELIGSFRRLATHKSLSVSSLWDAPKETIAQVLTDCNSYFQRNPYRDWFDQLEVILNAWGASYYDASACHLDLVQWATKPTWGKLGPVVQRRLLGSDAYFLREQLSNENIELLLVNGRSATDWLQVVCDTNLNPIYRITGYSKYPAYLFQGVVLDRVRVIAWSTYLQHRSVPYTLKAAIRAGISRCVQES